MPALSVQFPTARRLMQAVLLLALAGCSARPVHEQQPGMLPGTGTYTWESRAVEPVPAVPVRDAGPAGVDGIRAAIDNGLGNRGYEQRSETEAAWRVSYRTGQETRKEKLVPNDRMLQPRMVCNPPMECQIIHEFVHFGSPKLAENPEFDVAVNTVQVQIHDVRNGLLIWQGKVAAEPGDDGQPDLDVLRKKMDRLLRTLPHVRHRRLSQANTAPAAPPPQ